MEKPFGNTNEGAEMSEERMKEIEQFIIEASKGDENHLYVHLAFIAELIELGNEEDLTASFEDIKGEIKGKATVEELKEFFSKYEPEEESE